jgi:hypothetical protein
MLYGSCWVIAHPALTADPAIAFFWRFLALMGMDPGDISTLDE